MRSFLLRLLMVLRFQGLPFLMGVAVTSISTFGMLTYKAPPADSPFDYGLPFQTLFGVGILFGLAFVWWAWRKTPK